MLRLFNRKERTFYGNTMDDMDNAMKSLLELRDTVLISDEEEKSLNLAMDCITQIMNRMEDGKRIEWDD